MHQLSPFSLWLSCCEDSSVFSLPAPHHHTALCPAPVLCFEGILSASSSALKVSSQLSLLPVSPTPPKAVSEDSADLLCNAGDVTFQGHCNSQFKQEFE